VRSSAVVAIKIASHLVVNDRYLSRRFELEYNLAHPLEHPCLVKVFENGKEDKIPYMVMECMEGPSVAQLLKERGALSEKEALDVALSIADALAYLHGKQIIHRDVKPANILLDASGAAKLADLGLVKNLESLSKLTRSNLGLGTLQFVSPEQFDDARTADARSDIYSLAATLYVMLTGEYPFGKGGMAAMVTRKMRNDFEAPSKKAAHLPAHVDQAIRAGLDADRAKRPATAKQFADMLRGGVAKPAASAPTPAPTKSADPAPTPKAASVKKGGKERRGGMRYSVEVAANCRAIVAAAGKRWPGWIIDVSTSGLCLNCQRRFEIGSILEVCLNLGGDDNTITLVGKIRWAAATDKKSWLHGCEFTRPISEDDMNTIVAEYMDQTKLK
jgi:serine/threonine protein kinase